MPESVAFLPRRVRPWALAVTVAALAACRGTDRTAEPLADDLARDLNLASAAKVALPDAFGDTAATGPVADEPPASRPPDPTPAPRPAAPPSVARRPVAPAPAPAAAPEPTAEPEPAAESAPAPTPAPVTRTLLAAGTTLTGTTGTRVCTATNRPGDRLVMRLTSDVDGPDGTRIPAGTSVLLEVAGADSVVTLRVRAIQHEGELRPLVATASVATAMDDSRVENGSDKKKVIGGAIAGAIIGQVLGKDTRSTVIGAAGGAAAGAAAARAGGTTERCLPAGATVRVVLDAPLTIATAGV
jgi:hypothetical protein